METIPCIFGHGFSDEVAIVENGFQGKRCSKCKLIYISPRPSPDEVINLYREDQAHLKAAYHVEFNPVAAMAAGNHLRLIKWAIKKQGRDIKGRSLLEIGCGGGHLLTEAKKACLETFGIELNTAQAQHVQNNLGISCES